MIELSRKDRIMFASALIVSGALGNPYLDGELPVEKLVQEAVDTAINLEKEINVRTI